MSPTSEQQAVIDAARLTDDNLSVVALAGAAKTTTLRLIAEALPRKRLLCLAFNRNIANEMAEALPRNCDTSTLNGLGHKALGRYLSKRPKVSYKKNFEIVSALKPPRKSFRTVFDGLRLSKTLGYTPYAQGRTLLTFPDMIEALPFTAVSYTHLTLPTTPYV